MSAVRGMFEDLRGKPALMIVALALLVVLIAIPLLLAKPVKKPSDAATPAAVPAAGSGDDAIAQIANAQQQVTDQEPFYAQTGKRVRDFPRKNPFGSVASSAESTAGEAGTPSTAGDDGATTGSGTVPATTGGGTTGTGSGGTVTYYRYTAKVKFGKEGSRLDKRTLNGFSALPSSNNPIIIFLGIRSDGTTAVFLLSSSATTTGDGKCQPSDDECSFIYMTKGNSQTIEAIASDGAVTTYTLKLTGIGVKQVSEPQASSRSSHGSKRVRKTEVRKQRRQAKRKAKRTQKRLVGTLDGAGF
ncbi:MAG: hypothetical protein WDZ37_00040 [Solirubrobacterales bacterium]